MQETPRTIINDDPYSWDIAWCVWTMASKAERRKVIPWRIGELRESLARHPSFSEDAPELTRIFGPCRKKNITPWDKDKPQPALRELIESNAVELPRGEDKSALVPGCGSVSPSCLRAANHSADSK